MKTKSFTLSARFGAITSAISEYDCGTGFPPPLLMWLTMFLILLCSASIPTANAQNTDSWTNTTRSTTLKWETGANWSLGVPPSSGRTAVIISNDVSGSSFSRTINIDATTVLSNMINGCMTISNLALSIASGINRTELFLNNTGSAALTVHDWLSISNRCSLVITNSTMTFGTVADAGYQLGVDGTVVLEGGTITISANLTRGEMVGVNSSGTLTVSGGLDYLENSGLAVGYNAGSTGTVLITGGTLSQVGDNYLGYSGVGSFIQSGGSVSLRGEFVGNNPGSEGTLTVAGGSHDIVELVIGSDTGVTGTVWVTGGTLNCSESTYIGDFGVGLLIQSNGTLFTDGESIGDDMGEGLLAIAGGTHNVGGSGLFVGADGIAGNVWLTGGTLLVTNQGGVFIILGSLTQSNGALAASSESVGGFAEEALAGEGTLTIAGGTHAVEFGGLAVGDFAGSTGTVWVTGGELLATSFSNIIGADGVGSLVQSNGDVDMIFSEYVGNDAGADGTLIVAGGTHTIEDGELTVGNNAGSTGAVWIAGGQLSSDSAMIGLAGVGQMTVSNGSWQAEDVSVGGASGGNGILIVAGGTSVVSSDLTIGTPDCTATGTVVVAGGSLFVTNAAHNAALDVESGALTLSGGTVVVDVLVKTNPCASFTQTGGMLVVGGVTNRFSPALFSITAINPEGNNIQITWESTGGHTNAVQATNGGPNGSYNTNFNDLASFILGGSGEVTNTYIDPGAATNIPSRFYRIRLVP